MNTITKRLVSIGASLVLALNIASLAPFFVQAANAARTTNSATLNGGSSVSVTAGANITAAVNATISNGDDWQGTSWRISTTVPGSMTCVDTADHSTNGTYDEQFTITAPTTPGTYNAYFRINGSDNCSGQNGNNIVTLTNAVTVTAPDLTALKTNNVSGSVVVNQPFTWTIKVANSGSATANIADGTEILVDQRPTGTYTTAVVTTSGTTGSFVCTTSGTGGRDLSCKASGASTIPVGAYVQVSFTTTPTSTGSLANPRSGALCTADNANTIIESNENNNVCSDTVNVTPVPPVTNPVLAQSCGLDIGLVIDSSGSIDATELGQMKSAYTAFLNAFLPATPTQFSVTDFDTTASVVQGFTNNLASLTTAVNSPTSGGFTNWEDGLIKASSTFDPRPSVPNLILFASDGNPNTVFGGNGGGASEATAVDAAKTIANTIKSGGTRIVALGIGSDLNVDNLKQISGPTVGTTLSADVITSNFANLANDLKAFASELCGGTVTTTKIIDQDGNLQTTNDQTVASGWTFDVDGTPSNPAATATDATGKTAAVEVDPGTYSVNETQKAGYELLSANCTGAKVNGTRTGNAVTGLQIEANNIVSCTFINAPAPTLTLVKTVTNNNGGKKTAADFQAKIDGNNVAWSTAITVTSGQHTASELSSSDYTASAWGGDCSVNGVVTLAAGDNKTCTITNDDKAPTLTLTKIFEDLYNSGFTTTSWELSATGDSYVAGQGTAQSGIDFKAGSYTLEEDGPTTGIINGTWECGNTAVNGNVITIALGAVVNCTITNTAIQPKITLTKVIDGDTYGDTTTVNQFGLTIGGVAATSGTTYGKNVGSYSINEAGHDGYEFVKITGDAKCPTVLGGTVTLALGDNVSCTIHNKAKAPKVTLVKKAINDNGGSVLSGAFTLYAGNSMFTGGESVQDKDNSSMTTTSYVTGLGVGTYTLSEDNIKGYEASKWSCTSGLSYGKVTVKLGDNITCTITNDDQQGTLIVSKEVINDNSGEAEASDFSFKVTGDNTNYSFENSDNNTLLGSKELKLNAGTYTVTENSAEGYDMTSSTCSNVLVENGKTAYCTIVNNDIAHPSISVQKIGSPWAYEGDTVGYVFIVTNTGDVALSNVVVQDDLTTDESYLSGDVNNNGLLDVDEVWYYTASYDIPAKQQDDVVNTVIVCATQYTKPLVWDWSKIDDSDENIIIEQPACDDTECAENSVCATDTHTLDVLHPQINVVKSGPATALAGTKVTYTFTVTNAGDIGLDTLTVEDSITGTATYVSGDTNNNDVLDLDETWVYTADYTIPANQTAPVTNTVTVCSLEHLNFEEDTVLSRVVDDQNDAVQEQNKICDQDSHTLTIPQVLSETTTEPTPLVNTGTGSMLYVQIIALLNLLAVAAITLLAKRQKNN